MAATMDGQAQLVAGCFSSNAKKSAKSGKELFLDKSRVYSNWKEMIKAESAMPKSKRLDFITIATPNNTHFDIAKACLEAGFNVVSDKPLGTSLKQAVALEKVIKKSKKVFALTHNYTGYPMVKEARVQIAKGTLGKINKVVVEYPQGWLSAKLTDPRSSLGGWRTNPKVAGPANCIADIGIHAHNLVRYMTGLKVEKLCADASSFIPEHKLDDDVNMLLRFKGGAKGILYASQISTGEENGFNIKVYGVKAGLYWLQENPNYLKIKYPNGYIKTLSKGNPILSEEAQQAGRLPFGHPDGFIEAFANLYLAAFKAIRAELAGKKIPVVDCPGIQDGIEGHAFIETALASAKRDAVWTRMV
jgi:predicted dehydrogenase